MNFKINTSEKFTTITPETDSLTDSLTAQLIKHLRTYMTKDVHNVIVNMKNVKHCGTDCLENISDLQDEFYENNSSFVICEVQPNVMHLIQKHEMEDIMNITPTESEAWDIVQMEEIERELLDGEDPLFNSDDEDDDDSDD